MDSSDQPRIAVSQAQRKHRIHTVVNQRRVLALQLQNPCQIHETLLQLLDLRLVKLHGFRCCLCLQYQPLHPSLRRTLRPGERRERRAYLFNIEPRAHVHDDLLPVRHLALDIQASRQGDEDIAALGVINALTDRPYAIAELDERALQLPVGCREMLDFAGQLRLDVAQLRDGDGGELDCRSRVSERSELQRVEGDIDTNRLLEAGLPGSQQPLYSRKKEISQKMREKCS